MGRRYRRAAAIAAAMKGNASLSRRR